MTQKKTSSQSDKAKQTRTKSGTGKQIAGKAPVKRTVVRDPALIQQAKRRQENRRRLHAVIPWLLTIIAVYMIICYIVLFSAADEDGMVGFIGVTVVPISFGMFGIAALLIPFYLLNIAFFYRRTRENGSLKSKCVASLLNLLFFAMLLHIFVTKAPSATIQELFTSGAFKAIYLKGTELKSGGVIGGYLCELLMLGMGYVGAMIVCWVLMLLSGVFVFGKMPGEMLDSISEYFKAKRAERKNMLLAEQYEREQKEKERQNAEAQRIKEEQKATKDKPFELPPLPVDMEAEAQKKPEEPSEPAPADQIRTIPELAQTGEVLPPDSDEIVPLDIAAQPDAAGQANGPEDGKKDTAAQPTAEQEKADGAADSDAHPYIFPPISLLQPNDAHGSGVTQSQIIATSEKLVRVLESFKVRTTVINVSIGPAVTRYELQPAEGVKTKSIANLADDIALHLAARSVRIESPIPGKSAVGIELPNEKVSLVRLRELIETKQFRDSPSPLFSCLGVDVSGNPVFLDISKMPHLLIAGATGMGKSVCMNSLIISLLYKSTPDDVKLILIDPKKVEMNIYNGIPHLLVPVVTDPKKAAGALNWAVTEMERRFNAIQDVGAHDIHEYNDLTKDDPEKDHMSNIVIFIDELADLMMSAPEDVETSVCRLSQKARAAGIHLVIGTQRPSVDVITGLIKSNIPSRIAFTVASQVDSRTIIDMAGAEKLMGRGDMLYNPIGMLKPLRVQGSFVETKEVVSVCEYIKRSADAGYSSDVMDSIEREARLCGEKPSRRAQIESEESGGNGEELLLSDDMILPAIKIALDEQTISTSLLQRKLKLGYSRAAKIIDILEGKGFVSKFEPAIKGRRILISADEYIGLCTKLTGEEEDEIE